MSASAPTLLQTFLTGLVAGVAARLDSPSDALPTVRCVARPALVRILSEVRDALAVPGNKNVSAKTLLAVLVDAGLAHVVPLDQRATGVPVDRLYAVGFGLASTELDPIELLQAHESAGVVCYFTALAVHGLTTQLPTHHHIALIISDASVVAKRKVVPADPAFLGTTHDPSTGAMHPLGSKAFTYQGLPYYTTRREAHRIRSVQIRYLSEKSRFRVTTLEQTLVDTLHRPHSCGGPAVVYEAWNGGSSQIDATAIALLLRQIADPHLTRRVGYMLSRFAPGMARELDGLLPARRFSATVDTIPLLPGVPHTAVDADWGVAVP
jgi:predicted transcriptional regulator of viral defense system